MGTVPSEIGALTRLEFVSLNNNELVGALPRDLGLLTNMSKLISTLDRFQSDGGAILTTSHLLI
jgi:hypothetical protein